MYNLVEEYNVLGEIVAVYPSLTSVKHTRGMHYYKLVELLNSGELYNGYRYKYFNQPFGTDRYFAFPFKQYYRGKLINQFKNLNEAQNFTGLTEYMIRQCLNFGVVDDFGCTWEYVVRVKDADKQKIDF